MLSGKIKGGVGLHCPLIIAWLLMNKCALFTEFSLYIHVHICIHIHIYMYILFKCNLAYLLKISLATHFNIDAQMSCHFCFLFQFYDINSQKVLSTYSINKLKYWCKQG